MSAPTKPVLPANMHPNAKNLFGWILELIGQTVTLNDAGCRLILQLTPDQAAIFAQLENMSGTGGAAPLETRIDPGRLGSNPTPAILVAGTATVAGIPNKTGDFLIAVKVTAGGTPGACYSCQSASATSVKVNSQTAAGALQNLDTSTIAVYNLGNPQA